LNRTARIGAIGWLVAGVMACVPILPDTAPPAKTAPTPVASGPVAQSARSLALAAYYHRVQNGLVSQGLIRTDGGGPDVPFTQHDLVENFIRIALYDEYTTLSGQVVARQTPSTLRRWDKPVRMSLEFGASVPEAQRKKDRDTVTRFAARLSRLTHLPITMSGRAPNFRVLVLNEDERLKIGPRLRAYLPGISEAEVDTIVHMAKSTFCLVVAWKPPAEPAYQQAVAVIRGEHPDLQRTACFHEELAQGLGLSNDSPAARPSIFNDDEEFGYLTAQDELMLRMLYDPRMKPGMTPEEARPVAEIIAAELMGGRS